MKKIFCTVLSAVLMLGCCIPAAAVDDFDPPLWSEYGYESMEDMLADWGITEEDYADLVESERYWREMESWTDEQWDEYYEQMLDLEKQSLGLVYDLNVMINETPFVFDGAEPEMVDDRLMLPASSIEPNLGVSASGIDGAYEKDGETYIPARELAESLGYEVLWSDYYRTAVFIDREAIVSEINSGFTVVNSVLGMGTVDLTENYKGTADMNVKITTFDSINGDTSYDYGIETVVYENGNAMEMTIELDLTDIIAVLKELGESLEPVMTPFDTGVIGSADGPTSIIVSDDMSTPADEFDLLVEALETMDGEPIEMIVNLDTNMLYLSAGIFDWAAAESGLELPEGAWYSLDMSDAVTELYGVDTLAQFIELYSGNVTMGDIIYMSYVGSGLSDPVYVCSDMLTDSSYAFIADENFTERGGDWYYEKDLSNIAGMLSAEGSADFKVDMNGGKAQRVSGSLDCYVDYALSAMLIKFDCDMSADEADITGSMHIKNVALIEFELSSTASETNVAPDDAPPEGSTVIPLDGESL